MRAFGPDGLMVEMPGSVPLAGHRVVQARSALNVVVAADRVVMITAWERARAAGRVAGCRSGSPRTPSDRWSLHLIDARRSHGVYLGVVAAADGDDATVFDPATPAVHLGSHGRGNERARGRASRSCAPATRAGSAGRDLPVGVLQVDALGRVV